MHQGTHQAQRLSHVLRDGETTSLEKKNYREAPIISYKRGKSLKDILVKAKL